MATNIDLMRIRTANPADFESVLALNQESERFLSPLSRARIDVLHHQACLHQVIEIDGKVAAFVLALREGEDYDSVNYRWFLGRYERFMYVDRVVVSGARQGRGLGCVLYELVFAHTRSTGVPVVTCEYDIDLPNPPSERFHRAFGFLEVGQVKKRRFLNLCSHYSQVMGLTTRAAVAQSRRNRHSYLLRPITPGEV